MKKLQASSELKNFNSSHRVLLLHTDAETQNDYLIRAIRDALLDSGCSVVLGNYYNAIETFSSENCDVFFAFGGAGKYTTIFERICALATKSILWTTEDPYELSENVQNSKCFDIVITNDRACLPMYGANGRHLALAASLHTHVLGCVESDDEYVHDLSFIGTAWPNRVKTINSIISSMGESLSLKIGLPYNSALIRPVIIDSSIITDWRCDIDDFCRIANKSRIVLTLERDFSLASNALSSGSSPPPRVFEIAAAGGFQIYFGQSNQINQFFEQDTEIKVCRTEAEVIKTIKWAVANPDLRMKIARRAQIRVLKDHTYNSRVKSILEMARKIPNKVSASGNTRRRNILMVTHNVHGNQPGGGVEIYQLNLKQLKEKLFYLFPVHIDNEWFYRLQSENEVVDYALPSALHRRALHNSAWEQQFQRVLYEHSIDLVHYQHLLGHPLSLPIISHALNIPSVFTYHDHYLICDSFNLLDYKGQFCDTARKSVFLCDICLNASLGLPSNSQTRRRNFISRMVQCFDTVVFNTSESKEYLLKIYPEIEVSRCRVIEMMVPGHRSSIERTEATVRAKRSNLNVVILGNFGTTKGAEDLLRIFNIMRDDTVNFTILGRVDESYKIAFTDLDLPNVTVKGEYDQGLLMQLLANFDVSLHLSIWPETYLISLSEAWAAGLVPIATNLGAAGLRITDNVDGFKVSVGDPGRVVELLTNLAQNDDLLTKLKMQIAGKALQSSGAHLAELANLYDELWKRKSYFKLLPIHESGAIRFNLFTAGLRTNSDRWDDSNIHFDDNLANRDESVTYARPQSQIPAKYLHLPTNSIRSGDLKSDMNLDFIRCGGRKLSSGISSVENGSSFEISGWAFCFGNGPQLETFVQLKGLGYSRIFQIKKIIREDVAVFLQDQDASWAGFHGRFKVGDLPQGEISLQIVQVYDGVINIFTTPVSLISRMALLSEDRHSETLEKQLMRFRNITDVVQGLPFELRPEWAGIVTINGEAISDTEPFFVTSGDRIAIKGWAAMFETNSVAGEVYLLLISEGIGVIKLTPERTIRPLIPILQDQDYLFSGIDLTFETDFLIAGEYQISILQRGEATVLSQEVGNVTILPKFHSSVLYECPLISQDNPPLVVDFPTESQNLRLDSLSVDGKECPVFGLAVSGSIFMVDGWCWREDDLPGRLIVFEFSQGKSRLYKVAAVTRRADVAKFLNNPEAVASGFRISFGVNDIPAGIYVISLLHVSLDIVYRREGLLEVEIKDSSI